jgi:anaerobic sulfite reductase subunit B
VAEALLPRPHTVARRRHETDDTVSLYLHPVGGPPVRCAPGQFTVLYAFGVGEVPISFSGNPAQGRPLMHTIRAVGSVTDALCRTTRGAVIGVRGPYGTGWSLGDPADVLLVVAGGLGLAPLRPLILQALADAERRQRLRLLLGARSPDQLLFRDDLARWQARGADVRVTVDHAAPGWAGPVGVVTELLAGAVDTPDRTTALVCGPEVMMRLVATRLRQLGVPGERIQVSLERNMRCGVAQCGHCQLGGVLLCRDGPVVPWDRIGPSLEVREL